jgi:hypothetical protein
VVGYILLVKCFKHGTAAYSNENKKLGKSEKEVGWERISKRAKCLICLFKKEAFDNCSQI